MHKCPCTAAFRQAQIPRPARGPTFSPSLTTGLSPVSSREAVKPCCSPAGEVPSVRSSSPYFWRIVAPTALVMLVCNMDRICMSVAVLPMSNVFEWSPSVQVLRQPTLPASTHVASPPATGPPHAGPCWSSFPLGLHVHPAPGGPPRGYVRWQAGHRSRNRLLLPRIDAAPDARWSRACQPHPHTRYLLPFPGYALPKPSQQFTPHQHDMSPNTAVPLRRVTAHVIVATVQLELGREWCCHR